MLLAVLHVCTRDADLALLALEVSAHLDGQLDADLLLIHPDTFDVAPLEPLAHAAFARVHTATYADWSGDLAWPRPQNWAWQRAAKHISITFPNGTASKHTGWLWWEADACPLRPGWLAALSAAHKKHRRQFSGVPCLSPAGSSYMNGVGIYPFDTVNALANTAALYDMQQPFDIAAGSAVRASFTDLSHLMIHSRKLRGGDPGTSFDATTLALTLKRHPEAVFYHGCDSTLALALLGRALPATPSFTSAARPAYPALTLQHPTWPSGLFTFPASFTPTVYYNATVARYRSDLLLLTRRHRFFTTPHAPDSNTSDLAIFRIHPNMTLDPACLIPAAPSRYSCEQWEDPRACVADGSLHVSFATWVHGQPWSIRQSLCYLTANLSRFDVLYEPAYGGNHPTPQQATSHNKNWLFFQHRGTWHFIYLTAPKHTVVRLSSGGVIQQEHSTPFNTTTYSSRYGLPRGGTPPVLHDGRYHTFFHSSVDDPKWRRRYYMGAYSFAAEPPFKPLAMTPEPLLAASEADFNCLNSPLVVFPNGALLEDGKQWLLTAGVNDEGSMWLRVPHTDLLKRMVKV